MELLCAEGRSVRQIADALPISRPAVSRHLRLLKDAGLVVKEPRGTQRIYRLHYERGNGRTGVPGAGVGRGRRAAEAVRREHRKRPGVIEPMRMSIEVARPPASGVDGRVRPAWHVRTRPHSPYSIIVAYDHAVARADELMWRRIPEAIGLFLRGHTARTAVPVSLVVSTILSAVNQGTIIASGRATDQTWVRIGINYLVPYIVASVGFLAARRRTDTAD